MIIFILTNGILLLKLFIYIFLRLFIIQNTLSKLIIILMLLTLLKILYTFPRKRFSKLSQLRNYRIERLMRYALKSYYDHIYNIFIIINGFIFSILVVFYLKYVNKDKIIDLNIIIKKITLLIQQISIIEISLNIFIIILFLIIYFILMIRLTRYFKFHIIKRHLYFLPGLKGMNDLDNWYELGILHKSFCKICLTEYKLSIFIDFIYEKLYFKYKKKIYPSNYDRLNHKEKIIIQMTFPVDPMFFTLKYPKIQSYSWFIITKWHYILIIIILIYDLICNNLQINNIFYLLPWTFIYELYLKFNSFINNLYFPNDNYIHTIIYAKQIKFIDKNTLLIDNDFYDLKHIKEIYTKYVLHDFIASYYFKDDTK